MFAPLLRRVAVALAVVALACATLQHPDRNAEIPAVVIGHRTIGHTPEGDPIQLMKVEFEDAGAVVRWEFRVTPLDAMRLRRGEACVVKRGRDYELRLCSSS